MTVIRPNSISGITSITAHGGDITYFKSDGTRGNQFTHNVSSTGVITATKFVGPIEGNLSNGTINAASATITGNLNVGGTLTYEDVTNIDSIGIITARSTVSIADSIVHTGDTDTSIRFPGDDTITFNTGGVGRLQINSQGKPTFHTPGGDDAVLVTGDTFTGVRIQSARSDGGDKAMFQMLGSRGTNASPTILQSGDTIGTLSARGYDGNSHAQAANIFFKVSTTPGDGDMPGKIEFATASDGSESPSTRMTIDHNGHITKPNTPAFHVSRTSGDVSQNNYVIFNTVSYNNGSHYNNTDGKFTAPVTGIYFFSAWHFTGGTSAFGLRINGSQFGEYAWDDTGGCATWVCPVTANQYVQIYTHKTWRGSASYHNGFCGYLIG